MHHSKVLGVLGVLLAASGCSTPPANSMNGLDGPPTLSLGATTFQLEIVGDGTVTMNHASDNHQPPCAATGNKNQTKACGEMHWSGGGEVAVVATPAEHYRLVGFYDEFGTEMKPANDDVATRKLNGASRVDQKVVVKFAPTFKVTPIKAVFTQQAQMTTYSVDITNPTNENLSVSWVGMDCGDHNPTMPVTKEWNGPSTMTWHHPHPNCDLSTDHSKTRIGLVVVSPSQVVSCHYNGAHDGTGPECEL